MPGFALLLIQRHLLFHNAPWLKICKNLARLVQGKENGRFIIPESIKWYLSGLRELMHLPKQAIYQPLTDKRIRDQKVARWGRGSLETLEPDSLLYLPQCHPGFFESRNADTQTDVHRYTDRYTDTQTHRV